MIPQKNLPSKHFANFGPSRGIDANSFRVMNMARAKKNVAPENLKKVVVRRQSCYISADRFLGRSTHVPKETSRQ